MSKMSDRSDYWCNRFDEVGEEPSIEDFTRYTISSPKGKILHEEMSLKELKDFYSLDYDPIILLQQSFDYQVEEIVDVESYEEKLDIYYEELEICKNDFKIFLFDFHNVSGPKAERLFHVCFEKNRLFFDAESDFETFVEFIKEL
jgi:hypothetical protein